MSKKSELHALRYSFSGDEAVTYHSRSGDSKNGVERWNFIASVQSAEADIIDEEERVEQHEAKRKFAKLLRLYFKKILTPIEFKFLTEWIKGTQTPHKVGLHVGIEYKQTILSIKAKYKVNEQKLILLMQYSGYNFRHGLEFLPRLEKYMRRLSLTPEQREAKRERDKQRYRRLVESDREAYNAQRRLSFRKYKEKNRDKLNAREKEYRDAHREHIRELNRKSYEAHKDEINARKRAKRAAERETRKTSIVKTNTRERAQRVKTRGIKMQTIKTVNFIKQRTIKQKLECLAAFLRSLSYDFINSIWVGFTNSTADEETMTHEERATYFKAFYCSVYNAVVNEVQALSKILVNDVPVEEVIQEEKERTEQRCEEIKEIIGA